MGLKSKAGKSIIALVALGSGEVILRSTVIGKMTKSRSNYANPYFVKFPVVGKVRYRCSKCIYFQGSKNECRLVEGNIENAAGCIRWIGVKPN
ncbi:MAG: hypothetical protein IH840_08985 [Candidatus Heimdallarchaeota archaeon]|nr:hypothetical protein [Candidatus Heimdallarchaeota archaeon]